MVWSPGRIPGGGASHLRTLGDLTVRSYPYCAGLLFPFKAWRRAHSFAYATEAATQKGDNRTSKTGNLISENHLI